MTSLPSSTESNCQVCDEPTFKYRCAQCDTRTRTCSLACFKAHQSQCAIKNSSDTNGDSNCKAKPIDTSPNAKPALPSPPTTLQPDHVRDLFDQYPGLQAKLNDIYQSTRQQQHQHHHRHASAGSGRQRHRSQSEAISPEQAAFANGLVKLQHALQDDGNDNSSCTVNDSNDAGSQGINAFAAYVKSLVPK